MSANFVQVFAIYKNFLTYKSNRRRNRNHASNRSLRAKSPAAKGDQEEQIGTELPSQSLKHF